jgi:hypothetical protein
MLHSNSQIAVSSKRVAVAALTAALALGTATASAHATGASTHKSKSKPHHHYVITSANQISPNVLKKLHGASGAAGGAGATGPAGATGAGGANGANGAVAGYSASAGATGVPIGANTGTFVTVVSKSLPAGHYLLDAQSELNAGTSSAPSFPGVENECDLFAGATDLGGMQTANTIAEYFFLADVWFASTTISVQAAVNLTATTTVGLQCELLLPAAGQQLAGFSNTAENSSLAAVQTTANS